MTTTYTQNFQLAKPDFRTGPWHDLVNGDFDKLDALMYSAFAKALPWTNNTVYVTGTAVLDGADATTWMCVVAHTSAPTGTFAADRAAHPTYWSRVLTGFSPRGEWAHNTHYFPYDMAYQTSQGIFALCKTEHISNAAGTIKNDATFWSFIVDFSTIGLSTALAVTYNGASSGIPSTNVQAAIDYVEGQIHTLDSVNVTQGNNITALQNKDVAHETRLTNIETKNTTQDSSIASLSSQVAGKQAALGFTPVNIAGDTMTGNLKISGTYPSVSTISGSRSLVSFTDGTYHYLNPGDGAGVMGSLRPLYINLTTGAVNICASGQLCTVGGALVVQGNGVYGGYVTFNGGVGVSSTLTVSGAATFSSQVSSDVGYVGRKGTGGPGNGNIFNLWWNGSAMEVYVDNTLASSVVCDQRIKQNIQWLENGALDRISMIQTITYNFKDIGVFRDDGVRRAGFLADNLASYIPEAVKGTLDGVDVDGEIVPVGVDTTAILATLVRAVQELTVRVALLERRSV